MDLRTTSWRANELAFHRARVGASLRGRFWLRWHAVLIGAFSFAIGMWTDLALLRWSDYDVISRWLLALGIGYLALFLAVRLWLAYVGARPFRGDSNGDWLNNIDPSPRSSAQWHGHGGGSGGGGASGDWSAADTANATLNSAPSPLSGAGDAVPAAGDSAPVIDAPPVGGLVIVLCLIALALLCSFGAGVIYLIASAPELLGDVAFAGLLAGGLIPPMRRLREPDWGGRLLSATWKPMCVSAVIVLVLAVLFRNYFPDAHTLREALQGLR